MTSSAAAPAGTTGSAHRTGGVELSVVIVNWKVRDLLHSCLRTVRDQMQRSVDRYEVIVVDNASDDGSIEMITRQFPGVTVVANRENVGFGRANNQALPLCRGRYVLLLNPDTEILDHAIDRLVDHMDRHPDVGALGCRLLNSDGSYQRWTAGAFPTLWRMARHALLIDLVVPRSWRSQSLFLSFDAREDMDVDWLTGACLLLRREAVGDRIFDEAFFMYGEDTQLCERLKSAGWRVTYTPSATVVHHHGKSMAQQSGEILLSSFKGPRAFYIMRHGGRTVWLYDSLIAAGFLIRWVIFSLASLAPRGRKLRARARSSRSHLSRALQVMLGR